MALYYWLGITANGNVNTSSNWTLWGPQSATAYMPPAASTIPKYGDSVIFTKFGPYQYGFNTIYGPSGQLNGLCGPAGATTLQWLSSIMVKDICPVPLGTTSVPFTVRAENITLNVGYTNSSIIGYPTNLTLLSGSGATKPDASIAIFAKQQYQYNIRGQASSINIINNTEYTSRSYLNLTGLTLSGLSGGISILDQTTARNSADIINITPTTIFSNVNNLIKIAGYGTQLAIDKGSTIPGTLQIIGYSSTNGASVRFVVEGACGSSGASSNSRTRVYRLVSDSSVYSKIYPQIYVSHPVDFDRLDQQGGVVNFDQDITDALVDASTVKTGYFYPESSKIISNNGTVEVNFISK
jgi:hypothetical protein